MIKLKYFGRSDSVLLVHYCEVVHLNERVISSYREDMGTYWVTP
ncbi:hypothetical protein ABG775_23505 [Peribacillus simplex]